MTSAAFQRFQQFVVENKIRIVDLKTVDPTGGLRHVSLPVESFDESVVEQGVGFDGSSYGYRKVEASDMLLKPDLSTFFLDPFREVPTVSLNAWVCLAQDGLPPSDQDPRTLLLRAVDRVRSLGIADDLLIAPEYEFYVFRDLTLVDTPTETRAKVHGDEAYDFNAYHMINPYDRMADFRDRATALLTDLGLPIKYHHHETGGHGQQEIECNPSAAAGIGDQAMLCKYVLHNMAHREGLRLTFMPKPIHERPGSGWHTHHMMVRDGENVFFDPDNEYELSQTALAYIGGLLAHGRALAALTNPSTNSYKRLNSGFEAPVSLTFGPADRTSAVRIPRWARGDQIRIEYRPTDLTCNPYLALAAMVMAGLDGVERGLDPVADGYGPSADLDRSQDKRLPVAMGEALTALKEDREFLTRGGVFSDPLIDKWLETKEKEFRSVAERPHPYEFALYFDA